MRTLKSIIIVLALLVSTVVQAQTITSVRGTISDEMGPLMGATVCEIDGNGRIIESTVTDLNGNFTMKVKNQKDRIRFSFVGMKMLFEVAPEPYHYEVRTPISLLIIFGVLVLSMLASYIATLYNRRRQ